jgi:RNA polymerase sigma factor (sigma-70 family)
VRALGRPLLRHRLPRGRSDDALVARVRSGDERAFELVFDRYHRGLLAFCRHMLASNEEAEDALQHTFMAAYRALRTSDRPIRLRAWLYTIARNRCLSILRARREQVAFDDGHAAADGLAADIDRRAELRGLLADLERLPEEQRAALVLFELGDHGHDEIAEILGVRREKVKALVFQARESLASWRRARETPCVEIREQLATARGAALKRATLRRHVARCEGCSEFAAEVRRQRAAMAALLPVVPGVGLKAAVLGAVGAGAGGGGSFAGLGGAAKGVAAKTLLCAAVAGGAGSAGYVAVHEVELHDPNGLATASRAPHAPGTGASRAARAARAATKPIAAPAQAPSPVVVAATSKPATATPRSADRARHRHRGAGRSASGKRHHRHGGRGFERSGSRRARWADGRGHSVRDRTSKHSPDGRSPRARDAGGQRDAQASGRGRDGRRSGFAGRREHRGRDRRGDGAADRGSRERGDGGKDRGSRKRGDGF